MGSSHGAGLDTTDQFVRVTGPHSPWQRGLRVSASGRTAVIW
ncbi:hypothetical protein STAFG_3604 [Streptomyces afghaniensis 772]|uniref:Uncharacterized protein n=1 Tax=Streptomyces afghaniensis 772 TaxID=1283301 RepID=S4MIH4_9ACTN|nr:hypothetical protein STAFG_3604 [Streptomyces afghaniensis 772]